MRKFIIRIVLFLLFIVFCDYVVGSIGDYAYSHSKSGINLKTKNIRDSVTPDIVILGSSRAFHHYIPSIFIESLGIKTYNMGIDGNGILIMYPYLAKLVTRHTPKIVIYDLTPEFDLHKDDYNGYLKYLLPLKGFSPADSIMNRIDPSLSIKMLSRIYQHNSEYPSLLKGYIVSDQIDTFGYTSISGEMPLDIEPGYYIERPYSRFKLNTFDKLFSLCNDNDIELIVVCSPAYREILSQDIEYVAGLCKRNGIRFLDFSHYPYFINHPELFADTYHLNHKGAEHFTNMIADSIKSAINP